MPEQSLGGKEKIRHPWILPAADDVSLLIEHFLC
jgi:hypothetical protein